MDKELIDMFESVKILRLQVGDNLIVRLGTLVSDETIERIRHDIKLNLNLPEGVKVAIIPPDMDIEVIR